ncbi:MAG: (E)-4-hydroxy-3-methylbut-2-enyl-diphosphate synthase [Bacteroidales bacterium]|nr:(E)-4-hydroxy-3-methylbut-2-enyl-diphosphate synthase [Bacteroidales bacterium]
MGFGYKRRTTSTALVGNVAIGSDYPIRLQSMTSTSTMDTAGSVAQAKRIIDAGGEIVRLTAQGVREANNLANIHAALRADGYEAPLVADIHFNPAAADAAAAIVEKVRINPGNFVDPARTFRHLEYTDEEYADEIKRIEKRLIPLVDICREHSTALRIGVNHGSLSDRIMSRYGDTPAGVVESAMEFLRILRRLDFNDVVISIKASNTVVMVNTVRLLVKAMDDEDMHYPLHLGVTEAGNGEDGRIRSAVGIGALLAEGIGDTIRVSLSEAPECEIPVAAMLTKRLDLWARAADIDGTEYPGYNKVEPQRRRSATVENASGGSATASGGATATAIGGGNTTVALGVDDIANDLIVRLSADTSKDVLIAEAKKADGKAIVLTTTHINPAAAIKAAMHLLTAAGISNPLIAEIDYGTTPADETMIYAAADMGAILLSGFTDGISIRSATMSDEAIRGLSLGILQAARLRFSRTEFISCPGCGRTMFDLQSTVNTIKKELSHLRHLKIGVMGCIVNGPGEMADADYGYVGAGVGRISLYRQKECIERNIPQEDALPHLIALIKADGRWVEPEAAAGEE